MRLDRLDGVGTLAWFKEFAAEETARGFLEALAIHEKEGRLAKGFTDDFRTMLTTFQPRDFLDLYPQLVAANEQTTREEAAFLKKRLPEHCQQLCSAVAAL